MSFAYNCGVQAFKNSTLLKKINANQLDEVPNQLMKWINANGKALPGLWRRRLAEALLFMGIKEIPSKYDNDKKGRSIRIRIETYLFCFFYFNSFV